MCGAGADEPEGCGGNGYREHRERQQSSGLVTSVFGRGEPPFDGALGYALRPTNLVDQRRSAPRVLSG
jgi:hypothetical protein